MIDLSPDMPESAIKAAVDYNSPAFGGYGLQRDRLIF